MGTPLSKVNPGVRVFVASLEPETAYEVQARQHNNTDFYALHSDICVISEKDNTKHFLPSNTLVDIHPDDDVMHEYSSRCMCIDCQERRLAWASEGNDEETIPSEEERGRHATN